MFDAIDLLLADHRSSSPEAADASSSKRPVSEARLAANRANAQKSTGPRTPEGKQRSSASATRHSVLAQVISLPEDEMPVYQTFLDEYAAAFSPANAVEKQLAYAAADLQFRLNRLAAIEHDLFTNGCQDRDDLLLRSKDPLATLSIYEQRLNRRLMLTLKQLKTMQDHRDAIECTHLNYMRDVAILDPDTAESLTPAEFGFVCSSEDWRFFWKHESLLRADLIAERRQEKAEAAAQAAAEAEALLAQSRRRRQ